jgi:hypothetical protein
MKKDLGRKGFEAPSYDEMDKYLKQGKKSIDRMKQGKPPLVFRPPRTINVRIIGLIVFIVLSSTLFISVSLLSPDSPNGTTENTTTTPTTTQLTTVTTSQQTTTIPPLGTIENSISEIEDLIGVMTENHSRITPQIVNGTINISKQLTTDELLDLVWVLSQFEENTIWWNLGKELIFDTYQLWNESSLQNESTQIQLKALRGLLTYPSHHISLESTEQGLFENLSEALWTNVSSYYNSSTGMLEIPNNQSEYAIEDQLRYLEVLEKTIDHPSMFLTNTTEQMVSTMVEMIKNMTDITEGVPEYFKSDFSWFSPIYNCNDQNELILLLNSVKEEFFLNTDANLLISRVKQFVEDEFLQQDWSVKSRYNNTDQTLSEGFTLEDQILFIRTNIKSKRLNFAEYSIDTLREKFESQDHSYFTSTSDQETQELQDHVQLLLMYLEYLKLREEMRPTMASAWGMGIILLTLILIPIRRKWKGKK